MDYRNTSEKENDKVLIILRSSLISKAHNPSDATQSMHESFYTFIACDFNSSSQMKKVTSVRNL